MSFDIDAGGTPDRVAWTAARPGGAFLALDRSGNGRIDSGVELFGDAAPLADGTRAHDGYAALAELDLPARGGNGKGYVDSGDGGSDKHGNLVALVSQANVRAGQRVRPIPTADVFLVTPRGLR